MAAGDRGAEVKRIPLTQGLYAMVDDADYDRLMEHKWYAFPGRRTYYAARQGPLIPGRSRRSRRTSFMHAEITGYAMTDHIDGDGTNNMWSSNLRETTGRLNRMNTTSLANSASRFKGVTRHGPNWRAICPRHEVVDASRKAQSRNVGLGTFTTQEQAARAYDEGMRLRFPGEGTRNFPLPGERSAVDGKVVPLTSAPTISLPWKKWEVAPLWTPSNSG